MVATTRRVQLVQKLPNNGFLELPVDLPSNVGMIEYSLNFEEPTVSEPAIPRICISTDSKAKLEAAAILCCYPNLEESQSQAALAIQLRPDDIFYIDGVEVSICLLDNTQNLNIRDVEPSSLPNSKPSTPLRTYTSLPRSRLRPGATVMETPFNNSYLTPKRGSAKIINTITGIAIKENVDSQDWPADTLKRATLSSIREAKRQNQSSPTAAIAGPVLPSYEVSPSKGICQDSVDPRDLVQNRSSEPDLRSSNPPMGPPEGDTQIKDDTQTSNIRHADALLAMAEQPSSPVEANFCGDLAPAMTSDGNILTSKRETTGEAFAAPVEQSTKGLQSGPQMRNEEGSADGGNKTKQANQDRTSRNPDIRSSKVLADEANMTDNSLINQASLEKRDAQTESSLQNSPSNSSSTYAVRDKGPLNRDPSVQQSPQHQSEPSALGSVDPYIAKSKEGVSNAAAQQSELDAAVTTDEEDDNVLPPATVPNIRLAGAEHYTKHRRTKKPRLAAQDDEDEAAEDLVPAQEPAFPQEQTSLSARSPGSKKNPGVSQHTPKIRNSAISPRASVVPSSSVRSARSTPRGKISLPETRILFASSTTTDGSKAFMKFLANHGIHKANSVQDCTILCVGHDKELKRTSNLILAVLAGKKIVTENWVSESVKAKQILDFEGYLATDPVREAEWGTSLSDAIARGEQGVKPFLDWSFCFTPAVKAQLGKGFADLKAPCVAAGAKSIQNTIPRKGPQELCTTVVIATNNDKDLENLRGNGWRVYAKEMITLSILRGSLELESDEFLIENEAPKQTGKGKKRKR